MNTVFHPDLLTQLRRAKLMATPTLERLDDAVPLAKALYAGGVRVLELTLRTEFGLDAVRAVRREVADLMIAVGTILTPDQVHEAQATGAAFGMAPGFNPDVVSSAAEAGFSFAPGVVTPSEVEQALHMGCRLLKLYPCGAAGGLDYLRALSGPYAHLGVQFVPLGGVNEANLQEFLTCPSVAAVGGTWLAPEGLIRAGKWREIEAIARRSSSGL